MTGFVKFPLPLYSLCLSLSLAESRVLSMIVRQTLGWRKSWDAISLTQFQRGVGREPGTGMSRTQIVSAIRRLEGAGVIRVQRRRADGGHALATLYGVAEQFLDSPAVEVTSEALAGLGRGVVPVSHQGGGEKSSPTIDRSLTKETSTSAPRATTAEAHDDDLLDLHTKTRPAIAKSSPPATSSLEPKADAADAPQTREPKAETEARPLPSSEPLLSGLLRLGFAVRVAHELLETYPAEQVQSALENLPYRKARNPAGYLVSELKAGDYALPEAHARRSRALALRTLPQEREKEQAAAGDEQRMKALVAQLDEAALAALWQEARRKCLRFGRNMSEDSPMLRAQFELLVEARAAREQTLERVA